jgi:DNA primase
MDLLERKLQLLEEKGWFVGVDHQREALDRLLPTLRAVADPITRDLYLQAVSARTGVSRETLMQQVAARPELPPAASPGGDGGERSRWHAPDGPREGTPPRPPARRRQVDAAERDLLRVLMKDPTWIPRAAAEVPPERIETPAFRELYDALLRSPENAGSSIFLEQLSPSGRRAWAWLDSHEAKYGTPDLDRMYVGACSALEVRPLRRELAALTARLRRPDPEMTTDVFDALIKERTRLTREIRARFPEEAFKRTMRRGDVDAR